MKCNQFNQAEQLLIEKGVYHQMKPISMESYIKKHSQSNPHSNPESIRKALQEAVKSKKNGETCSTCGSTIWALGSAFAGKECFTCITGDTDSSDDYEIREVCW